MTEQKKEEGRQTSDSEAKRATDDQAASGKPSKDTSRGGSAGSGSSSGGTGRTDRE